MGYYNPFYMYGIKRFAGHAHAAGVDGVLIVDLPPEEAGEMKAQTSRSGLDLIFLLAPTSNEERIKVIAKNASGFIYYVSLTGVTGANKKFAPENAAKIKMARTLTNTPICVGFGVSTLAQAKSIARIADGVIVGSAIVKLIEKNRGKKDLVKNVTRFVWTLAQGL